MNDLISRQEALNIRFSDAINEDGVLYVPLRDFTDGLKALPSAQPERKTGHWIKTARWGRVYYCDQCRNYLDFDGVNVGRGSTNFCPNCGADMRGEQDDESRSNSNAQTDTRARGMGATDKSSGI